MGCFFGCFRMRERKRQRSAHIAATATPPRCREHAVVKNRTLVRHSNNPASEIQAPNQQFFEVLNQTNPRKKENLHRRTGANVRWAQQLVTPAEVLDVQKPRDTSKRVEEAQTKAISNEKNAFEEVNELALELSELTRKLEEEVEDVRKFGEEVKYLKARRTLVQNPTEIPNPTQMQMVSVSEQSMQSVASAVKRVVSRKQSISVSTDESVVSEAQYAIHEVTKPTGIEVKVSNEECLKSKPPQNVTDSSNMPLRRPNMDDQNGSSCKSVGKTVTFDFSMDSPSASLDSANTRDEVSSYDSTSDPSVSQSSYTEEEEEESVVSEKIQSSSYSYTGSEATISDVCTSGHSASPGSEDDSISSSGSSSIVTENGGEERIKSNAFITSTPAVQRQPRYQHYESSDEEEYDSLSDTEDSYASIDSSAKNENQVFKQHEAPVQANQSPPLQKSNYSPQQSPFKLVDDKQSAWTGCPKALENAAVNNNARIRAQYVYPVLNPVENLSQWKALKKDPKTDDFGSSKEFYEKNKSWADYLEMAENKTINEVHSKSSPTKKQRVGTKDIVVTDSRVPAVPHTYSIPLSTSVAKENIHSVTVVEQKKSGQCVEVKGESCPRRKLIPFSADPIFKEPKAPGSKNRDNSNAMPQEVRPSDAVYVDTSLSHWLRPAETVENVDTSLSSPKDGKAVPMAGQSFSRQNVISEVNQGWTSLQTQISQAATTQRSPPSKLALAQNAENRHFSGASGKQTPPLRSPSRNFFEDRPILGALSIQNLQSGPGNQISPRRSPSSKSPDDRPILGAVGAHWNDNQPVSPSKWEDGKAGIPNSTDRYKEDQKVSWNSTPFEVRLERALSNGGVEYQRHATDISS
eukprot:Gb_38936 [translate_table: standard]